MPRTLRLGIEHTFEVTVSADHTPGHLLPAVVLSTPSMIGFMEEAATAVAQAQLDDGETTVGTHVDVSHESAARLGDTVTFLARLTAVDDRRLTFEVSATAGERVIGRGTHLRHVINRSRFSG